MDFVLQQAQVKAEAFFLIRTLRLQARIGLTRDSQLSMLMFESIKGWAAVPLTCRSKSSFQ
jgi:hypothetical protein